MSAAAQPGAPPGNAKASAAPTAEALGADRSKHPNSLPDAIATASVRAADQGFALHELASGGYLIGGCGLAREAPDLRAVGAYLRQLGRVRNG